MPTLPCIPHFGGFSDSEMYCKLHGIRLQEYGEAICGCMVGRRAFSRVSRIATAGGRAANIIHSLEDMGYSVYDADTYLEGMAIYSRSGKLA